MGSSTIGPALTMASITALRPALTNATSLDCTARQRLDAQVHFAELARAAGLFLVAAVPLGFLGDGLAIGNLRRRSRNLELVLLRHLLQLPAQVQVAQAAHHGFVGGGMALDLEARVFQLEVV